MTFVQAENCDKFLELLNFGSVFNIKQISSNTMHYSTKTDNEVLCKRNLRNTKTNAPQNQTLYFESNHPCIKQGRALIIHPEMQIAEYLEPTRGQRGVSFGVVLSSFDQVMADVISSRGSSNSFSPPNSPQNLFVGGGRDGDGYELSSPSARY